MRASVAPSRQSQLPSSVTSAAAVAKLLEKKKEFEAVAALERASAQFLKRIEDLGDDFDVMADAGLGMCWSIDGIAWGADRGAKFMDRSWSSGRTCSESSACSVRIFFEYLAVTLKARCSVPTRTANGERRRVRPRDG